MGGKSEYASLGMGRAEGNGVGGGVGVAVIVSQFPEGGDVYLLSLLEHLHVKKAQFLCGQGLSGLHFLLDRAECGVRTPGKG